MPDQTNNVSGGLSQLLKTAKPGRAEPTIGRDTSNRNVTAFSNKLDQARQQQLDKTRAEPSQPGNINAGKLMSAASSENSTPSVTMVQVSRLHGGGLVQDSVIEESAAIPVISNAASDMPVPAPITKVRSVAVGEIVRQGTLAGRSSQLGNGSDEGRLLPVSPVEEQPAAGVADTLMPGEVEVSATALLPEASQQQNNEINNHAVMTVDSQGKLPVTATLSEKGSGFQASNKDAVQLLQQHGAASTPGISNAASDMPVPAPITKVRSVAVGEIVRQGTLAGRSSQLGNGSDEGGLLPVSPVEEQPAAGVADTLMPREVEVSATALLPEASQQQNSEINNHAVMAVDSQGKLPVTATLSEKGSGFQASNKNAVQVLQQHDATSTPVVSDTKSSMTSPTPIAGTLHGTTGEIVTQVTLAGRSRQLATAVEKNTGMANAPGLSMRNSRLSGEGANAAMTTPEPLVSDHSVKSALVQANPTGLAQTAAGNGIVTQATLAGRLRQQNNDAAETGAEVLQKTGNSVLLQTGIAPLNARGLDRMPASDTPVLEESPAAIDSVSGFTDGNKTVHQRIATTEAMLAQMAVEAGIAVVKAPTTDNMLLAMSGAAAASVPAIQHSDSVAGPIIQAPLNIPLASDDAETALAGNVKWMTNEGVKNAVMTVTPHGMGPISIKIGIDGNQMDVSIIASQHTTRDALESMLPRLREQLTLQGHDSVKLDVSDGKGEQSRSGNGQAFAESRNPAGSTPQDNQSNSSKKGEKTEYDGSEKLEVVSESFMAGDLQRVAARVVGEVDGRPVFDAYV